MKNSFAGFYNPSKSQITAAWKSDDTIFIFDTNVLLSLYSYQEATRESFLSTLDRLKEKIWIPYQVGMEYQFNRLKIISENKKKFSDIEKSLETINSDIAKITKTINSTPFEEYHLSANEILQKINPIIDQMKALNKEYADKCPEVRSEDRIRKRLNILFNKKTGVRPRDQKWIDDLAKEGKERYDNNIPPGFEDRKKAGQSPRCYDGLCYPHEYGDLILWKQIIEHVKEYPKKNVIFVTGEKKSDWLFEIDSHGKKIIGPHANLQAEIYRETSAKLFHICDLSEFLETAKERVPESTIDQKQVNEVKNHIHQQAILETLKENHPLTKQYPNDIKTLGYPIGNDPDWEIINSWLKSQEAFAKANRFQSIASELIEAQRIAQSYPDFINPLTNMTNLTNQEDSILNKISSDLKPPFDLE